MCDKELIKDTIITGSRGKRKRADVKKVLADVDGYTDKVYDLLLRDAYEPTRPKKLVIKDGSSGKEREISVVPYYPDGIIHQLAVTAMKKVLMRGMYHWSCASIPGRGNAHAMKYVKRALKKNKKGTKYCAKMDIRHYYPSIKQKYVMRALERKIKDKQFLNLIRRILASTGDGLAIGFYINQWLANYLLEPVDHFIRSLPGVKYYVRNMDDFVLLGSNKRLLHRAVKAIAEYIGENFELTLKNNWQVFPVDKRGIDFVGYRFFHGRTILRRRNFLKFERQCRKAMKRIRKGKDIPFRMAAGLLARAGQLKHCNGVKIRQKYFDPIGCKRLKRIIRRHSKMLLAERSG